MILEPLSFNGTSLQSATFDAFFPEASAALQMQTNASYVKRAGATAKYSGKDFQPYTMTLSVECATNPMSTFETLNTLFDTKDETPRQLIAQETTDSTTPAKQWYVYATAEQVLGGHDGTMATVKLAVDDPIWQSVTQNSQVFSTTSSTATTDVTAGGNDYAYPIFEITPASLPGTEYLYNLYVQVLPQSNTPWSNRFLDITGSTDTTFDTAALVAGGKMQADGDDLRVFQDGVEVDRWLDGMNTTDTHVIVVADMPARHNMILKTAIASTDTVTEIELTYTLANKSDIQALPHAGRLILDSSIGSTDTEEFSYTAKTVSGSKLAFTISARSVRNTNAFSFSAGANVRYLPYDFTVMYGNAAALAPTVDDTTKPIQALTSRNSSFTFTNFYDEAGLRAGIWDPYLRKVSSSSLSRSGFFTSTNDEGDTDPATAMGLAAYTYEGGGVWRSDSVQIAWLGYFPDIVSSVSASGEQYQTSVSYPAARMRARKNMDTFTLLWQVSAQATTDYSTWTAWTKASTDAVIPSGTRYLEWMMGGTILGSTDQNARVDATTVTVGLTNYPHVMLRVENSNYRMNLTIGNTTTGETFDIVYPMFLNSTIYVDTDADFPTVKYNGQIVNGAIRLSSIRSAWLKLNPGVNAITYQTNNTAASDISINIKWRDRLNFF